MRVARGFGCFHVEVRVSPKFHTDTEAQSGTLKSCISHNSIPRNPAKKSKLKATTLDFNFDFNAAKECNTCFLMMILFIYSFKIIYHLIHDHVGYENFSPLLW